mmetsp:Transcript_53804/g.161024  ORF Transcript_53804/g.161024 Transcript_53804/m.161024 type:complete len:235 (-) Transcript_53804:220-924(-)
MRLDHPRMVLMLLLGCLSDARAVLEHVHGYYSRHVGAGAIVLLLAGGGSRLARGDNTLAAATVHQHPLLHGPHPPPVLRRLGPLGLVLLGLGRLLPLGQLGPVPFLVLVGHVLEGRAGRTVKALPLGRDAPGESGEADASPGGRRPLLQRRSRADTRALPARQSSGGRGGSCAIKVAPFFVLRVVRLTRAAALALRKDLLSLGLKEQVVGAEGPLWLALRLLPSALLGGSSDAA